MQLKTLMRYHYAPMRTAKIQNTEIIECWQGILNNRYSFYIKTVETLEVTGRIQNDPVILEDHLVVS